MVELRAWKLEKRITAHVRSLSRRTYNVIALNAISNETLYVVIVSRNSWISLSLNAHAICFQTRT
jgi:hypothetical protein